MIIGFVIGGVFMLGMIVGTVIEHNNIDCPNNKNYQGSKQ